SNCFLDVERTQANPIFKIVVDILKNTIKSCGSNPGDDGVSQTPSSHVVHAGPNLDHMDLGIAEASSQPNTEQMDDEFTFTAYLKVQENLKLPIKGEVRLEEPASSAGTLSSMKNLYKDLSFTDQFLVEKSQED
ncbi:hypothetical protein Tco_0463705, partial [Tanacetum coccineum]